MKKKNFRAALVAPIVIFTVFVLYLVSCTTKDKTNKSDSVEKIVVHVQSQKQFKLSEISANSRFLKLDSSILTGEVSILKTFNENIYIYDDIGKELVCFSMKDGKHLFTIDNYGEGPGEFVHFTNFAINPYLHCLEIVDNQSKKILRFDMNDGSFIAEFKILFNGHYVEPLDGNHYVVFSNHLPGTSHSVLITDEKYNVVSEHLPSDTKLAGLALLYPVRMLDGENHRLLSLPFSNEIYSISSDGGVTLRYSLDFPGCEPNDNLFDVLNSSGSPFEMVLSQKTFLDRLGSGKYCWDVECFYDSEQLTGFQFRLQKKQYWFLHSEKMNRDWVISQLVSDDGEVFMGKMHCFDHNRLIASVYNEHTDQLKILIIDLTDF
ncbi:MAG: 6-bladed beta-propeller [Tannerella sp.]|nr:6-bladed beta-propeller [Tannerella sp.]